jgi:hypothetical protein
VAAAGIVLSMLACAAVRAQEPPSGPAVARPVLPARAVLVLPECGDLPFDREALVSVLGVELLESGVALSVGSGEGAAPAEGVAVIVVEVPECGAGGRLVSVRIEHPGSGLSASRALEVSEQARPVQSRVVALAIAELLRAEWEALEPDRPQPVPAEEAPGAARTEVPTNALAAPGAVPEPREVRQAPAVERGAEAVSSRRRRTLRTVLDVVIDARAFAGFGGAQIGSRIGASFPLGRAPLRLDVDVGGWYGLGFDPLGSIDVATVLAGATLSWSRGGDALGFTIGPRVELGWGRAAGRAADAAPPRRDSFDAVVSILTLRAALRARLNPRVLLLVDGQVGYVLAGIEARSVDRRATGVGGPVIALGIGLSIERRAVRR